MFNGLLNYSTLQLASDATRRTGTTLGKPITPTQRHVFHVAAMYPPAAAESMPLTRDGGGGGRRQRYAVEGPMRQRHAQIS